MRVVYLNGSFLPEEEALISPFDRGFLFADAVYEVTSVIEGRLIDFDGHWERLQRSLGMLKMGVPMDRDTLREFATATRDQHDPAHQDDPYSRRCAECNYIHHPCDTFDLAEHLLLTLDRLEELEVDGMTQRRVGVVVPEGVDLDDLAVALRTELEHGYVITNEMLAQVTLIVEAVRDAAR